MQFLHVYKLLLPNSGDASQAIIASYKSDEGENSSRKAEVKFAHFWRRSVEL
jgi:hypothetical protein